MLILPHTIIRLISKNWVSKILDAMLLKKKLSLGAFTTFA
jgi:hypothetical protein